MLREGEAEESVNAHILARTFHDLDRTAPRLRALARTLEDAYINPGATEDLQRVQAACEDLEEMCSQLRSLFTASKEGAVPSMVTAAHHEKAVQTETETPATPPPARKHPGTAYIPRQMIVLTPKKKQNRKESYGS